MVYVRGVSPRPTLARPTAGAGEHALCARRPACQQPRAGAVLAAAAEPASTAKADESVGAFFGECAVLVGFGHDRGAAYDRGSRCGRRHAEYDSPTLGQIHAHNEPSLVRHRVAGFACRE